MKKGQQLSTMLRIAVIGHDGQFDRGGNPYILHPLKVLHYLKSEDEELQAMAVGHDLFEDTSVTAKQLRDEGITERVIAGLRALTKMPGQTYEEYKAGVLDSVDAMLVKRADLRHNTDIRRLKSKVITEKDMARIARYHAFHIEIEEKLTQLGYLKAK